MSLLFTGKEHAGLYVQYRPQYTVELYDKIFEFLDKDSEQKQRHLAVDVGCGSGQNTWVLAKQFDRVIGIDTSEAQLEEAKKLFAGFPKTSFKQGFANNLVGILQSEGFQDVNLITVATALHWFDVEPFFQDCLKMLRHGGALVAFSYGNPTLDNAQADLIFQQYMKETVEPYFEPQVRHVYERYKEFYQSLLKVFPKAQRDDSVVIRVKYSLHEFFGFLRTYSSYQVNRKQNPDKSDPVSELATKFKSIYGTESKEEKVVLCSFSIFMLFGKKV